MRKKTYTLSVLALMFLSSGQSQTETYITPENFALLPQSIQDKIKNEVIVVNALSEVIAKENKTDNFDYEGNYIKQWMGMHQEVKILNEEEYSSLNSQELLKLNGFDVMIIAGEKPTLEEIKKFEAHH